MQRAYKDAPDGMRKKAQELQQKARMSETPGYAEQLVQTAENLEQYAAKIERRG